MRVSKPVWVAAAGVTGGVVWLLVAPFIALALTVALVVALVYARIFVGPLDFGPHPPDRWGLPTGRVTAAQVAAHPEAHLYYPGARVVTHGVGGEYYDAFSGGEQAATAETVLLVKATPVQVTSWYTHWLSAHGWRHDDNQLALGESFNTLVGVTRDTRESFDVGVWYRDFQTNYGSPPPGWIRINLYYGILPYKA